MMLTLGVDDAASKTGLEKSLRGSQEAWLERFLLSSLGFTQGENKTYRIKSQGGAPHPEILINRFTTIYFVLKLTAALQAVVSWSTVSQATGQLMTCRNSAQVLDL